MNEITDQLLLSEDAGRSALLLGNEAIVRGAIEAGVAVVSGYPGTPASEIGDTLWRLAASLGIRCEYSVNEKVALEVAAGAAQGGVRSLVSFKHLGLNVAADPLPTLALSGVQSGMVIVTAGDPGNHTSPNEQDQRLLAKMARLPMLEPATPEQARALTVLAFELSEELGVPVLVRPTTRVSHTRGVVTLGQRRPIKTTGLRLRDPAHFVPLPPNARRAMAVNEARLETVEERLSSPEWSIFEGQGPLGVVSCGVAACYVREAIDDLDADQGITHLQLPSASPMPSKPCMTLLERCETVLVVEELQPVVEEQLRSLALELDNPPQILGKLTGLLPRLGEYSLSLVRPVLAQLLGDNGVPVSAPLAPDPGLLPARPPVLCPGCPHRASFAAVRLVFDDDHTAYVNDIGCYSLGYGEPLACADFLLCMGSSITQASGMSTALAPDLTVAFIGDSTFLHSGMTGLLNAVACDHDVVMIILDNGTTAMTGHQPHAGIAEERGWPGPSATLEAIVKGLGVTKLWEIDPLDVDTAVEALTEARDQKGVRVVIARHACPVDLRRLGKERIHRTFRIDTIRCRACATKESGLPCSLTPSRALSTTRILRSLYSPVAGQSAVAPCTQSCPLGVCIPGYTGLVGAGELDRAAALVRERNPLPSVCSRVCHAPCEDGCMSGETVEESVAINALKRVAVEQGHLLPPERPAKTKDTHVAVVGSGPAGLACTDELARRGVLVTIYEAAAEPGGLLRYGIPPYRLPREALTRDIENITTNGVTLKCNVALGRDISVDDLLERHDAVFLGIGAWIGLKPAVTGSELAGVTDCLSFLGATLGKEPPSFDSKRVVVIGGGDAAIDCARTAVRLGAEKVSILYRRGRSQMPAEDREIDAALSEGVSLIEWGRPIRFQNDGSGKLSGITWAKTQPGPVGSDGRVSSMDLPGTDSDEEADLVVAAVGQQIDESALRLGNVKLVLTEGGTIDVDPETGATSHPRVFAGGDAVSGPATVVEALADGKRSAWAIDRALNGEEGGGILPCPVMTSELTCREGQETVECSSCGRPRVDIREREPSDRRMDFGEVESTLSAEEAASEALRCLGCAPCAACDACLTTLGCPAIVRGDDGRPVIDDALCNGCGLCARFCPAGAIVEEDVH